MKVLEKWGLAIGVSAVAPESDLAFIDAGGRFFPIPQDAVAEVIAALQEVAAARDQIPAAQQVSARKAPWVFRRHVQSQPLVAAGGRTP